MEFNDIKFESSESSGLEEIQPSLEEIKDNTLENNEATVVDEIFGDEFFGNNINAVEDNKVVEEETISKDDEKDIDMDISDDSDILAETDLLSNVDDNNELDNLHEIISNNNSTPATEIQHTTVVASNTVHENSTVNISASTIAVNASNVVLSSKNEEKVQLPIDYSNINSHKGSIELASEEKVIREYRIVKGSGRAIVTNERLVLDCDTRIDLPIEKVGGVGSSHKLEVKTAKLIFGFLFVGIFLFTVLFDLKKYIPSNFSWAIYTIIGIGSVFGLIGLLMIIFSFKRKFMLNIFGDGLLPIVSMSQNKREAKDSLIGLVVVGRQGKDFACFTGEIGALLLQIKEEQKRK